MLKYFRNQERNLQCAEIIKAFNDFMQILRIFYGIAEITNFSVHSPCEAMTKPNRMTM